MIRIDTETQTARVVEDLRARRRRRGVDALLDKRLGREGARKQTLAVADSMRRQATALDPGPRRRALEASAERMEKSAGRPALRVLSE